MSNFGLHHHFPGFWLELIRIIPSMKKGSLGQRLFAFCEFSPKPAYYEIGSLRIEGLVQKRPPTDGRSKKSANCANETLNPHINSLCAAAAQNIRGLPSPRLAGGLPGTLWRFADRGDP
jgi:hypothetical protein